MVVQKPNVALYIFIIFSLIHSISQGSLSQFSGWLAFGSGLYWGLSELLAGVNLFRKIFGAAVTILLVVGRF